MLNHFLTLPLQKAKEVKKVNFLEYNPKIICYFWIIFQIIRLFEESDGAMTAFEMKWNPTKKILFSKSFTEAYNVKETVTITPDNYLDYL